MRQVGFLFNHRMDQVWHAAPVAFELSRLYPGIKVDIVCANRTLEDTVQIVAEGFPQHCCHLRLARVSATARLLGPLVRNRRSLEKKSVIRDNGDLFRRLDALIVPDLTSLKIKAMGKGRTPKMIFTRHGAGDRAQGFDRRVAQFDFVLVQGRKIERRLRDAALIRPGSYRMIGYPKFDAVSRRGAPPRLFDNDRPVVLYNPHFESKLSSWHTMGLRILEYFRHSDRYNLIFAPHLKLFSRAAKYDARLPRRYRQAGNIHVDTGSLASTDMSYTLAADLYLGDVSSQVYEFLWRPRPCIFLNAQGVDWRDDPNYAHWHFGPVLAETTKLDDALDQAWRTHKEYLPRQRAAFAETFDLQQTGSATRAAHAIGDFLGCKPGSNEGPYPDQPAVQHKGEHRPEHHTDDQRYRVTTPGGGDISPAGGTVTAGGRKINDSP